MEIKLNQGLSLKQQKQLVMTPKLIESIRILQYSMNDLVEYIDEQLLDNPVLEQIKPSSEEKIQDDNDGDGDLDEEWKEYINNRQYDDISYRQSDYRKSSEKEPSFEQFVSGELTLADHLKLQLDIAVHNKKDKYIGNYIIESLDENGYMSLTIAEISNSLKVSEAEIYRVLNIIQTFDPYGVGAEDLKQCLLIQIEQQGILSAEYEILLNEHLDDLAANRMHNISKSLRISRERLLEMVNVIRKLNPKPGSGFASQDETKYIIPDVYVENVDGEYRVDVNDSDIPELIISPYYRSLLNDPASDTETTSYLYDHLNAASWLIKSIEQRKNTIFAVAQAIAEYQSEFFMHGPKHLKAMTMKQIADITGIHESTVSRAVSGKYMQSPYGVFEMKYFFSQGVTADNTYENMSYESIKIYLKEMISDEDSESPYSDQDISDKLKEKNMNISRRTVAKYREEMGIPSSTKRRKY